MRAAKIPSCIAVTAKGVHYVVTTVNVSASCQAYTQEAQTTKSAQGSSSLAVAPFRFTSLLPCDWSSLLRMCRRLTHPGASFNFSSPGDTAEHDGPGSADSSADAHVVTTELSSPSPGAGETARGVAAGSAEGETTPRMQNHAYMHIVQRVPNDFTPNNMIYHQLQKFHLVPQHPCGVTRGDAPVESSPMAAFTELVASAQQQPPQDPREVAAELLSLEDSACAAASAEAKRARDPLCATADAQAKSQINREQLRAYGAACTCASASALSTPYTFTFYPYPVSAADSIPYCSQHFCVLVNLKPIVPNHLMVVPIRCVGTIHGLTEEEVEDWGHVMRCTLNVLEEIHRSHQHKQDQQQGGEKESSLFSTSAGGNYSIAVQQGALAGQTVDHLHVHVIPFDPKGKLAGEPETDEAEQRRRPPRTAAVMRAETDMLRPLFAKHAAAAAAADNSVAQ